MKLFFKSLFQKKDEPLHAKKINQLSLNLKPIAKYRNIPINHPSPRKQQIRKSKSLQNVTNAIKSLRRSSSLKKFNKKQNNLNLTSSIPEESCQTVKHHQCSYIDITNQTSIFDNSCSTSPYDISYTEIYNTLYPNNSPHSSISIVSNKENIPPQKYSLSQSQTPNYSFFEMTPLLTSTPKFEKNTSNPFIENPFDTPNDVVDPFFDKSFENSFKGLISPQAAASSSSSSLCSNKSLHNLFKSSNKPIAKLPKLPKPSMSKPSMSKPSMPKPSKSPNSIQLLNYYNQLLTENNINENDIEEKSLFDALSNVECYDCSKITLFSYDKN